MGSAAACRPARLAPGARQALILLGALALCPVAAALIGEDAAAPVARARALIDAEKLLGIHVEPAAHAWALAHPGLLTVANVFYVFAHVPVAGWALIWTWFLRRDRFALVRDAFVWTQVLLVAVYVAVPTAPPRLVPGAGFTDTLGGLWGKELADSAHLLQSPFAAMPSGHVAFALLAGATFARLGDMAWLRVFGWLYPPLVVVVTVLTGHHLLLDAGGAAVLVACAGALAWRRSPGGSPSPWKKNSASGSSRRSSARPRPRGTRPIRLGRTPPRTPGPRRPSRTR